MNYPEIIADVTAREPRLTDFGLGVFRGQSFDEERAALLTDDARAQFEHCCAFLDRLERTQNINPRAGSSYGLKHVAERWGDLRPPYVTNGVFIAAAIHRGFKIRPCEPGSPNAFFNIGLRSRRRLAQEREDRRRVLNIGAPADWSADL